MTNTFRAMIFTLVSAFALVMNNEALAEPGQNSEVTTADRASACAQLQGISIDAIDAPTKINSAKLVNASGMLPAFCQVQATVKPDVGVEVRLPSSNWNGKFFLYGRGGYCRTIAMDDCDAPLQRGYACLITDQGHKSTDQDDVWMHDNLQAQVDCGFRGTHVAAQAGKAITKHFYRQPPRHSYFMGCSTGGRMGMLEAQRFPYDFDGIIAGAAPINKSGDGLALMWNVLATLGKDGRSIFSVADIQLLSRSVMARCDADDGLKDGIISMPLACRFDPSALQCKAAKSPDCFTADQVAALRKIYAGPVNSKGERLYDGSVLPGSELNWIGSYIARDGGTSGVNTSVTNIFRFMNEPERGPDWKITQFNWDEDYKYGGMLEAYNSASNPDLRSFKAAGGKLLVFHGFADEAIMPQNMMNFYELVERTMGGRAQTQDFFRLFMVPGLNHCAGGVGATVIDYLSALEAWVEQGKAPNVLIGSHVKAPDRRLVQSQIPDPASVAFTRPIYPYPLEVKYKGSGDPNDAANFRAVSPKK